MTVPTVDIHTIGAGGGSIARVDEGGMLLVGPESAGADPGPACYGQGGTRVTVTDANVVLGRIPADTLLGGYLPLDVDAANQAMDRLANALGCRRVAAAEGVLRLANEHMARALRVMSVERGHDPRDYALLCFGGAGGLHACALAELLGMDRVLLPALAGVLSAHGMLASEPGRELSRAMLALLGEVEPKAVSTAFAALEEEALSALEADGVASNAVRFRHQLEQRYRGQNASLVLSFGPEDTMAERTEQFHRAHERNSGHRLDLPVELVNLRLSARARAPMTTLTKAARSAARPEGKDRRVFMTDLQQAVPVLDREGLKPGDNGSGPCIVVDQAATAWVAPGWGWRLDDWGNLHLERSSG